MANPFDLNGPDFLGLYFGLFAAAVAAAAALRWYLRQPGGEPDEPLDLGPYEVAYLAGGEKMVVNATLANLVHRGAVAVDTTERSVKVAGVLPDGAHVAERAVLADVASSAGSRRLRDLHASPPAELAEVGDRLKETGLVPSGGQAALARLLPTLTVLAVAFLGLAKLGYGVSRGKPVGFLVAGCVLTVVVALAGFARRVYRSRRGDRALAKLREENEALETTAKRSLGPLTPGDVVLAMSLFGPAVLAAGPLTDLRTALKPPGGSAGGCGSSCGSGCGASGCGGGGGGGCGGGGGGCGGCGG